MICNYNMIIDFARPQKSNTIVLSENDAETRMCNFKLLFDKEPFDMTGVVSAIVKGVTQSGATIIDTAEIKTDAQGNYINELSYLLPLAVTENAGNVTMTIELDGSNSERITSFEYYLKTRNALYNEDDVIDQEDLEGFHELLIRSQEALARMEEMVERDALPNPYPLRYKVDGVTVEYTGEPMVEIDLDDVGYLGDATGLVEVTEDDSSAQIALEAAEAAAASAAVADEKLTEVTNITNDFENKIPVANVVKTEGTSTITIRDQYGTTTAEVEDGLLGPTPSITAAVTVDSQTGTPSCTVTKTGTDEYPTLTFAFSGLKGAKGDTGSGSSVEWGEIYGDNLEAQTDLVSYIEGKTYHRIVRTGVTASAGGEIRIPAGSDTDSRISTASTCVVRPICEEKSGGKPYKFKSCVVSNGYATITMAEAIASPGVTIGVEVINY